MRYSLTTNKFALLAILAILPWAFLSHNLAKGSDQKREGPKVLRLTPAPPVINEKDWHAELAQRRARVAQAIGPKAMLILFSAETRIYTGDVTYEYRQENNLYYLTNLNQKRVTLVLLPGNKLMPEILFLVRRSPFLEMWNGRMYSAEDAARVSGIKEIWDAREFGPFMRAMAARQAYRPKPENVLMSGSSSAGETETAMGFDSVFSAAERNDADLQMLAPAQPNREYVDEQRFAAEWVKTTKGFKLKNAMPIFFEMRLRKSPIEIRLIQHAIDITIEAQQRAWLAAGSANWEYEVKAEIAYTFKLRNADHWAFPLIVGCGSNATKVHYWGSQGPVRPGDLILMDVGAEYEHYAADVTRTVPVSGKFSESQAQIYQVVYDAQEAAARAARPGAIYSDVHRAAIRVIKEGLLRLGLITDRESEQYLLWFPHDTTHGLGMNVHDVGFPAKLEPGMVFTNEPGIYIGPDALDYQPAYMNEEQWEKFKINVRGAFVKYKGIGVRIEDDMLVTADGVRWMTEALPRRMSEIETFIARGRDR